MLLGPSAVAELSVTAMTKTNLFTTKLALGFMDNVVPPVSVRACPRAVIAENAISRHQCKKAFGTPCPNALSNSL